MSPDGEALLPGLVTLIRSGAARDRAEVLAAQEKRFGALIRHAARRVPYYQRLFERAGLRALEHHRLADLERIPVTSKADLSRSPATELVARGVELGGLLARHTSGSTGEPLTIRRAVWEERLLLALRLQVLLRGGLCWTDHRAFLGLFPPQDHRRRKDRAPFYSRLGLLCQEEIHCLLPVEQVVARLREAKPDVLIGFPAALTWVAEEADANDLAGIRPRFIVTGAEVLTPAMRQRISEGFRARVFDQYGSHEFVFIAWECPKTGLYHVCEDSLIVEVLQDGRPVEEGETGELVGTALHSFAMPFIRYRLGDIVTRGPTPCPCGAPFSTIAEIRGRLIDRFAMADGTSIHPFHLEAVLKEQDWIRRFQIIQETQAFFRVLVVPRGKPTPIEISTVGQLLTDSLSPAAECRIQLVKQIPPDPANGKFYPYLSIEHQEKLATRTG